MKASELIEHLKSYIDITGGDCEMLVFDKAEGVSCDINDTTSDGDYVFETTNEFPDGYEIWAIGRRNFKHKGYVPLCEVDESRYVKIDTLKALKVKDEALALTLLSEAVKRGVNKKKYNIMINAKENG